VKKGYQIVVAVSGPKIKRRCLRRAFTTDRERWKWVDKLGQSLRDVLEVIDPEEAESR
jgi:hypothetical protein